jgi:hypothetical protein
MKSEVIRVSKSYRPLKTETVITQLREAFPEFEYIPLGDNGDAIVVKKSNFIGARVDIAGKEISIRHKVPRPFARALDFALLGTISAATAPKMTLQLKKFFKEKYAS